MSITQQFESEVLLNMKYKRIVVYAADLRGYMDVIDEHLFANAKKLTEFIAGKSMEFDPPYPVMLGLDDLIETYHVSSLRMSVYAAVMKLHAEIKKADHGFLLECISEYQNLQGRLNSNIKGKRANDAGSGASEISIPEDKLDIFDEIAEWFDNHDMHIPYLIRNGKPSHRIVACISVIYTGRKLAEEAKHDTAT